ncbi:hypothetical protein K402DRAFT_388299 [Aulographum hederae CBS 113979]|uniref:Uncharacterized protein n=1 Tax=Aulographum hederae CBS 113979 TaxID=1176131 RepID=A0A6G1HFE9_9PEZI|nr:hypothetical protein K402DRAFT_388299 [Aulographum hederae CBS 113979]
MPLESIPADVWPTSSGGVQATPEPGSGTPVFAASFFRFADGKAVGLCIQTHHNTMGGFGFAEIVKLWARGTSEFESHIASFGSSSLKRSTYPCPKLLDLRGWTWRSCYGGKTWRC